MKNNILKLSIVLLLISIFSSCSVEYREHHHRHWHHDPPAYEHNHYN